MKLQNPNIPLFFFLWLPFLTNAQEQIGLRQDFHAGINSIFSNPANTALSPFDWDVSITEVFATVDNNYAFFQRTSLFDLFEVDDVVEASEIESRSTLPPNTRIVDFYEPRKKYDVLANAAASLPSFMVKLPQGQRIGLFARMRGMLSDQNIPSELKYSNIKDAPEDKPFTVDKLDVAAMSWAEIGIHFSQPIQVENGKAAIGGQLKYLLGYDALFFRSNQETEIFSFNGVDLIFDRADIDAGLTTNNARSNDYNQERNGSGIGIDLGFVRTSEDYGKKMGSWKWGVSLLDLGSIRFNKNAQLYRVVTGNPFEITQIEYQDWDNPIDVMETLSLRSLGDPQEAEEAEAFSLSLPAALSTQFDYQIDEQLFVSALWVQRLRLAQNGLERTNLIALSPRIDGRWFGLSLPFSVYDYNRVNIGLAIRAAFLTIGSDNIGSFRQEVEFTGSDFYLALKVNPFRPLSFNGNGNRKGKRKKIKCYEF